MPTRVQELTAYVLLYVVLVDCLIALFVVYEIFLNTDDSWEQTVVNIAYGVSAAVAVTIVVFANVEVVRLLARMYDERRFKEGLEKGVEREREAQSKRRAEAYERYGVEIDGVRYLPTTPEVEEFLKGQDTQAS